MIKKQRTGSGAASTSSNTTTHQHQQLVGDRSPKRGPLHTERKPKISDLLDLRRFKDFGVILNGTGELVFESPYERVAKDTTNHFL